MGENAFNAWDGIGLNLTDYVIGLKPFVQSINTSIIMLE